MSTSNESAVEMVRSEQPCLNCGAPMLGEFCYACGQPKKGMIRHLPGLIADFFDSVFNLDTRTLRTLGPLLTRPGFLSNEYFAGRRTRYVTPLRLYLFMSVLAFLMVSMVTPVQEGRDNGFRVSVGDPPARSEAEIAAGEQAAIRGLQEARGVLPDAAVDELSREITAEVAAERARARDGKGGDAAAVPEEDLAVTPDNPNPGRVSIFGSKPWHPVDNPVHVGWLGETGNAWLNDRVGMLVANSIEANKHPAKFVAAMFSVAPQALLMILPVFALLLKIFFVFKRRLYMEHLIVALHSHSFLCLSILLLVLLNQIAGWTAEWPVLPGLVGLLIFVVSCWIPLYLLVAQKRIYGQGWPMTLLKYFCIGIVYTVLLSFGLILNLLWALASL
ncbi:MAG: DUF3667 domain-containing protein [Rhodanobacteraceae bacterium]|nr:DUF3667 domain-containing protein [Rhodanobacteraceae bacterium]MBP6079508.1 DUF3667 domain-containing protein [Xanthomonadales bacterium]MBP7624403.1 DUF3667 domain-containing protein [Xanthomonadales bacterium]